MAGIGVEENEISLCRLRDVAARLDEETLQREVEVGWTVAAAPAHLAFWDQSCLWRWDALDRAGEVIGFSDAEVDLVNMASLPIWRSLPGRIAVDLALQAAEAVDARVASASDDGRATLEEAGQTFMLDRAGHRNAHLDQIEALLARDSRR
jgi:hypothetical protein